MTSDSIESGPSQIERVIVARIDPGEDLLKSIEAIAQRERISAGAILSVVGSLRTARLRNLKSFPAEFPVSDIDRLYETIEGPLEILSVCGNICRRADNRTEVHAHMTVSKVVENKVVVLGGHLAEGNVTFVMVEVIVGVLKEGSFTRTMHPKRRSWEIHLIH